MSDSSNTKKRLPHDHGQAIEMDLSNMPASEDFSTVADVFKQMGDGKRVMIFWFLCHAEECGTNIAAFMNMSPPAVAHHLKLLKEAGLIVSVRRGKEVYYKAAPTETADLLHHMIEAVVMIHCPGEG